MFPQTQKLMIKHNLSYLWIPQGIPCDSVSKQSAWNAGDPSSISGSGRSPGKGNDYPLQYYHLENSKDRAYSDEFQRLRYILTENFTCSKSMCTHSILHIRSDQIRSNQLLSRVRFFATPWIAAHQASLSNTNSQSSLRLTSIESVG